MKARDILIVIAFFCICVLLLDHYVVRQEAGVVDGVTTIEAWPDEELTIRLTSEGKYMMIVCTKTETFFLYRLSEPWNLKTATLMNAKEDLCLE